MQVVKSPEHGFLFKPFCHHDQPHVAVTAMFCFDLLATEVLFTESDMWTSIQPLLGDQGLLDMGMPKSVGEVLLMGACYPSDGATVQSRVSVQVGTIDKSLDVTGRRHWHKVGGVKVSTEAEPFTAMDLTWANTFGGTDHDANPLGVGLTPVEDANGKTVWPRPCVEYPDDRTVQPSDRVRPAAYAPLDVTHPQRRQWLGTYDQQWLTERWPGLPDDFSWRYFNAAPEDQRLAGYFLGTEQYTLRNLHPQHALITGQLPSVKPRCFLRQLNTLYQPEQGYTFVECALQCDTLWLFPSLGKGILLFHGTHANTDDEGLDISHVLLTHEHTDQLADKPPKTLDDYDAELSRRLERPDGAGTDTTPEMAAALKRGQQMHAELQQALADIPTQLQHQLDQVAGKVPNITPPPMAALAAMDSLLTPFTDAQATVTAGLEQMANAPGGLSAELKQTLQGLDAIKDNVGTLSQQLQTVTDQLDQAQTDIAEQVAAVSNDTDALAEIQDALKTADQTDTMASVQAAISVPALQAAPKTWAGQAQHLVAIACLNVQCDATLLPQALLRPVTVRRAMLGWLPEPVVMTAADWGLSQQQEAHAIGPGWLIPQYQGDQFHALLVRPAALDQPTADCVVPGSTVRPWVIGANEADQPIPADRPVIVSGDAVGVWRLAQAVGTSATVVWLPQDLSVDLPAGLEDAAVNLFWCVDANADADQCHQWRQRLPQLTALRLPEGQTLYTLTDLAGWFVKASGLTLPTLPTPSSDSLALTQASDLPALPDVKQLFQQAEQIIHQQAEHNLGGAPEQIFAAAKNSVRTQLATLEHDEARQQALAALDGFTWDTQAEAASLEDSLDSLYRSVRASVADLPSSDTAKTVSDQIAELESATASLLQDTADVRQQATQLAAGEQPNWVQTLMAQLSRRAGNTGKDDSQRQADQQQQKRLSREQVEQYLHDGLSLAHTDLSELDLRGLDFSGVNLESCRLDNAQLSGCSLQGACLKRINGTGLKIDQAAIRQTDFTGAILTKADCTEVHGEQANFTEAVISEANFTGAHLPKATLVRLIGNKSCFDQATLTQANFSEACLFGARLCHAKLTGSVMTSAILAESRLDHGCLRDLQGQDLNLWGATGQSVDFAHSQLPGVRLGPAKLPDSHFQQADLSRASIQDADLTAVDMTGANLNNAYITRTTLTEAQLAEADLKMAQLTRNTMDRANLCGVNALGACFAGSSLVQARINRSNLFAADLRKVVVKQTQLHDTNLKRTLLHQRQAWATKNDWIIT